MKKNITIRPLIVTLCILIAPLIATFASPEFNWSPTDFLVMGTIIFCAALFFEFVSRKGNSTLYRIATLIAVITGFLLLWVNMAVGVIGEDNPANLLYLGVILIGLVGVFAARFQAHKISRVLLGMAILQVLIPVAAYIFWPADFSPGFIKVFHINAVFALLWMFSALLFERASTK